MDLPPDPALASPYVIEHSGVTSALVSGQNIVLVVTAGRSLDLEALLEGRGLVPEGKSVVGWQQLALGLDRASSWRMAPESGASASGSTDLLRVRLRLRLLLRA